MNMSFKNITLLLIFVLILFSSINFISAVDLTNSSISEITNDDQLNDNFDDVIAVSEFNELDNEILEDEGTDESVLDEGYVIYVGTHNKTETGNGSYENPFSTLKLACDNVSGQDKVTVKVFNGTYYMGSHLQFNTNNLFIEGINGSVVVTYLYDKEYAGEDLDCGEAFGLTSTSANFTISNIIFDGRNRASYDSFWEADPGYPDDPEAYGPGKSFFLPFYGYANIGTFNNCSFLFGNINTRLTGAGEYKSRFINCYFDVTNNWHLLFYGGQVRDEDGAMLAGQWAVTGDILQFEYCSFNLPTIERLVDMISLPCSISINNSWFGQNNLPGYLGPYGGAHVAKPDGHWDFDWTVPVNRYARFSVSENYLGNNQFEIVGKLTWNGTDSQEGMENFQPMTVTLSSDTGDIVTKAILINGTFKANYTSQSPINKITATLDSQPLELKFYSVNISADAPSIFYGQDQNLTLNFTQPIDATIVLTVSNENYNESYEIYVNNKDSIVYQIFDTLKEGIYTVDINLNDNRYYGENSTTLTISKISDYLFDVIIPSEAKVGGNATIILTLPEDVDGNVTIKFGNNTKILDANHTITVDFNNLNATTYNVNVTYSGSDKYTLKEKIDSLTIDRADSSVNVENIAFTYGDVIAIPFNVTNASGVNVRVLNKDGDEVTTTTSESNEFTLETLPAGEYTLEVTTIVDEKNYYDFTADNIVLTIYKADSSLSLNDSYEFIYGQDALINVITKNSTGNVIVSLIGEEEFTASVSGNTITLPALNAGKYALTVTTNVDNNHTNVTKSATIIISQTTPSMNVSAKLAENITVKDNITLTVNLPSDATGEVVVKINGKKVDTIPANETITINLNNQATGDYVVDILYSGDKNYESDMATKEYTISKAETSMSAKQIAFEEGNPSTIEVTLPNVDSGIVLVDVSGKKFYGDINNGKATIVLEGLSKGNYTANIKFFGDEKYKEATTTADVNVSESKIITELKEQLSEAQANATQLFNNLTEANAKVENLTTQLGEAQANATQLNSELVDANQKVEDLTTQLNETQTNATQLFNNLTEANAKVENLTTQLGEAQANATQLNSELVDANQKVENLTTQLNETQANATKLAEDLEDANQKAKNLTTQLGDAQKQIQSLSADLISTTVAANNFNIKALTNGNIQVTLKANGIALANKTVNVIINGVVYNGTTGEDGIAKIAVKFASAGTYYATVTFAGDDTYKSSIGTSKVVVSKKATKITAPKKSFKAKVKTKKVKITLKSGSTVLKSKKITLKVNGKTYTAKTNSKGVATIKVTKLTKKSTFTYTVKFAGDKAYKAITKKGKMTIK